MTDQLRVVCVADEPAVRDLMELHFENRSGVTAESFGAGGAALAALEERRADCVVSAQALEGLSGLELLDRVRQRDAELPFVLFVADGSERLVSEAVAAGVTDYVIRGGTNPFGLLVERAVDYAEQHRDRAALERVRERYELAGRAVSDVIWERSLEDGSVRWGAGIERTLGYDRDGTYDRAWWLDRVHPEDRGTVEAAWAGALAPDEPDSFECSYRFRRADDSTAQVVDSGEVVREDGEPVRLVGALRDVTDRREREAQLTRQERELTRQDERLEDFAGVVSHDLRNPLNVARGRVELARETGDLDQLAAAEAALERMDALVDDILELARDRDIVEDPVSVPLGDAARVAWANVPGNANATLRVETDTRVMADPDRLQQLLENLLGNALQHGTGEGGQERDDVTVRVGHIAADGGVDAGFYVADDGAGIPPARRPDVFDAGHTTAEAGSGFGLAIVREIAAAHGWTVAVTESDAGGARFEVREVSSDDDTADPDARADPADPADPVTGGEENVDDGGDD